MILRACTFVAFAAILAISVQAHAASVDLMPLEGAVTLNNGNLEVDVEKGKRVVLKSGNDYRNFRFSVEFNPKHPGSFNVFSHAHYLPDPKDGGVKKVFGRRVAVNAGGSSASHGEGKWNTLEIRAEYANYSVSINGSQVVDKADSERFLSGAIVVVVDGQNNGAEVHLRNAQIEELPMADDWRALFDGTSLDGWKEWGSEKWAVEDGVILGSSGPQRSEGYLSTNETFRDFQVRGKFKMTGQGNFGLFYHSSIRMGDKDGHPYPFISGLQGEVDPAYPGPTGWVYESYKRGWLVKPDRETPEAHLLRPGLWNEIEIRSVGNRVTTWVNGMRVLNLTDNNQQLTEGFFALQLHTGGTDGIGWKDLYVRRP